LETLIVDVLFTGSEEDEYVSSIDTGYFSRVYADMIKKIGHGSIHIFKQGGHPAIISNSGEFRTIAEEFFYQ
jgi:hypothetical protein